MRGGFKADGLSSDAHWHSQEAPGLPLNQTQLEEQLHLCSSAHLHNTWHVDREKSHMVLERPF